MLKRHFQFQNVKLCVYYNSLCTDLQINNLLLKISFDWLEQLLKSNNYTNVL
jgi:hypothetical protein